MSTLRQQISDYLRFTVDETAVSFITHETSQADGYTRYRISYASQEGDTIPAYLLLPEGEGPFTAVLVHHQHNSQRHLGKSEVCGLTGDPWQAFGPALARQGIAILAPDSICFEDQRLTQTGIEPHQLDDMNHFNEMCYRLVRGDTLMRQVLNDSARAISLLQTHPLLDAGHIGILGHSYGGSTVLFHAALDNRIQFACSSGAACSYRQRMANLTGIEMAQVIPGFAVRFDIVDLVKCIAPRHILVVSATADKNSLDADEIVTTARNEFVTAGAASHLEHKRYQGGHPLTQERFEFILKWVVARASDKGKA